MKNGIIILILFYLSFNLFAQSDDDVEIYIIDSYVTSEVPHVFKLSFYTSEPVKAKVIIDNKYKVDVSTGYQEDHNATIDFSDYHFNKKDIPFAIWVEDKNGKITKSEDNELTLPYDEFIETKEGNNPVATLMKGVLLYLLPSPAFIVFDGKKYFGITKEIPVVTFYSSGYNYPAGYLSLEYSHVYNSPLKNFLRIGYKQIFPVVGIEFLSVGASVFTNFKGFNGVSPELTIGLFKFYNVFTVYTRYRYNIQPTGTAKKFQEISVGLYSNFFTIDF